MSVNYKFDNGGSVVDFDDVFIRKDLFSTGGVWLWGDNAYGQNGDNTTTRRSSPVQTVAGGGAWKLISSSGYHNMAIKADGTLWTWGKNSYGQLGDNSIVNRSSPVQTIAAGTNWKSAAAGPQHSAAIKTDGTLWMWGRNDTYGALGDGTLTSKSSPVQTVAGGANWKQVSVGGYNSVAIKTDGTLWTWGWGGLGQLGDGTTVNKSSPVQTIAGGTNWKSVSTGNVTMAAIKTDGTLWLWGYNNYGQLGDNTTVTKSSPVQTISGGTNWKLVSRGYYHTMAIKTDGTLWTWGKNANGQLGDGTIVRKSSPVQTIAGGTNWKAVGGGFAHTGAVKTDGTMWTWGDNLYGQLGDGTTSAKSSPVQTIASGTNWKTVSIGSASSNTTAIREDFY